MSRVVPWKPGETDYIVRVLTGLMESTPECGYPCALRERPKSDVELAAEAKRARKAARRRQ